MKCSFDSSMAFKWVIAEIQTEMALRLRDEYKNGLVELLAPDAIMIELPKP
jgi:predicted nucleic acid-binding protein